MYALLSQKSVNHIILEILYILYLIYSSQIYSEQLFLLNHQATWGQKSSQGGRVLFDHMGGWVGV